MQNSTTYFLLIFFVTSLFSCQESNAPALNEKPAQEIPDIESQKAEILKTIEGESRAFYNKNFEEWASYYKNDKDLKVRGWNKNLGTISINGWADFQSAIKDYMESNTETGETSQKNIEYVISENIAFVTFDQKAIDGASREIRALQKVDGKWNIIYVGFLHDASLIE